MRPHHYGPGLFGPFLAIGFLVLVTLAVAALVWWLIRRGKAGKAGLGPQPHGQVHPLAGIALQHQWEAQAYVLGGSNYSAPAQLVGDFLAGRPSSALGSVQPSYRPGIALGDLSTALPSYAIAALREALPAMGRKIKG